MKQQIILTMDQMTIADIKKMIQENIDEYKGTNVVQMQLFQCSEKVEITSDDRRLNVYDGFIVLERLQK